MIQNQIFVTPLPDLTPEAEKVHLQEVKDQALAVVPIQVVAVPAGQAQPITSRIQILNL